MVSLSRTQALLRLELSDAVRSRWLAFVMLAYTLVFGAFAWLGLRESSVLGFTGLSRVVLNAANAVVVLLPLVALVATSQSVVRARSSGLFELLLSQPCRVSEWFAAVVLARLIVLAGPLLAVLALVLASGELSAEAGTASVVLRAALVSVSLIASFTGLGLCVSAYSRSSERAVVMALLVWLWVSVLHDFALIGVLLGLRVEPHLVFGLSALNPVEAARLALLSSVDPELSVLGPVGFWLANAFGARLTLLVGASWPLLLAALGLTLALRRLQRSDLSP
ncbi:MAG: ABC transporter permease [Myxococcota bacterium]